jgi:hypothetical protein
MACVAGGCPCQLLGVNSSIAGQNKTPDLAESSTINCSSDLNEGYPLRERKLESFMDFSLSRTCMYDYTGVCGLRTRSFGDLPRIIKDREEEFFAGFL